MVILQATIASACSCGFWLAGASRATNRAVRAASNCLSPATTPPASCSFEPGPSEPGFDRQPPAAPDSERAVPSHTSIGYSADSAQPNACSVVAYRDVGRSNSGRLYASRGGTAERAIFYTQGRACLPCDEHLRGRKPRGENWRRPPCHRRSVPQPYSLEGPGRGRPLGEQGCPTIARPPERNLPSPISVSDLQVCRCVCVLYLRTAARTS